MDYLTLGELDKDVSSVAAMHGETPEFSDAWDHYKEVFNRHRAGKSPSVESTLPREVRDAFAPVWEMYRKSHEMTTGTQLPQLPK